MFGRNGIGIWPEWKAPRWLRLATLALVIMMGRFANCVQIVADLQIVCDREAVAEFSLAACSSYNLDILKPVVLFLMFLDLETLRPYGAYDTWRKFIEPYCPCMSYVAT